MSESQNHLLADNLRQGVRFLTGIQEAPVDQVRRAFQLAFVREPATEEIAAAAALVESHGLRAFCRALLNSSELIYID